MELTPSCFRQKIEYSISIEKIMMDKMDNEILQRYIAGQSTPEELRQVLAWIRSNPQAADEFFRMEELTQLAQRETYDNEKSLNQAEADLFSRIKSDEIDLSEIYSPRRSLFSRMMQYAAIFIGILLVGGIGYMTLQEQNQEQDLLVVMARDKMKALVLPDGTHVWLNKNTVFKYPRNFEDNSRKVYLEGEGYFEVTKDAHRPFTVYSDAMQVKVLGTRFNLRSEKLMKRAVATLHQGEIQVRGNHDEGMIILTPGQEATLDGTTKRLSVRQVDEGMERWHDNSFSFQKANIFTISNALERWYGVNIKIQFDVDTKQTFTGTIKKKATIKETLDLIKLVVPIEYSIKGQQIILKARK